MVVANHTRLDEIIELSRAMLAGSFSEEEKKLLEVVHRNAVELKNHNLEGMNMIGLSAKSHDLRQPLTAVVGYGALLNSPKLANHDGLSDEQLKRIYRLHDLCRHFHWHMDNMVLFSNYIVRPKAKRAQDGGMLDIRAYLLAQADNYVCREVTSEIVVPEKIPFVYANDASTKLMIRGLFAAAMAISDKPDLRLSAYTVMKVVRARLCVMGQAQRHDELMKMLKVKKITEKPDAATTHAVIATIGNVHLSSMLEIGLYVATNIAAEQGGRIKLETDEDNLVFTLTMPTLAPAG
ncbi:MAG: hypothetical protein AAFU54_29060 [Chloroflexota bacterium]